MRLMMTGGSGFVGRSLLGTLLAREDLLHNFEFVSVSRTPHRTSAAGISWAYWDVRESCSLQSDFDVIVHAATPASAVLNSENPDEMYRLNVLAMENVIEFAARHQNPPVVLFTSSGAVYGEMPDHLERFSEGWERPQSSVSLSSAYAQGKVDAEALLTKATLDGKCQGLIARLFAFSGVHLPLDRHFAIGNFVRDAVCGQSITIRGNGSPIRSYMDGQDMSEWIFQIIGSGSPKEIYHVGSERAISIKDLASLVSNRYELLTGNPVNVDILDQTSPLDGVSRYVPSTERTRTQLNLKENVDLEQSIDQMIINGMKTYKKTTSD
jgi:nucleoside-diphosphate-sugar epimerase